VMVRPSVDPAGAGVGEHELGQANSLLPTADRLLPTVRPIGLVGPMSNFVAPPQLVENVPYDSGDTILNCEAESDMVSPESESDMVSPESESDMVSPESQAESDMVSPESPPYPYEPSPN
jgi:hypothetical protein